MRSATRLIVTLLVLGAGSATRAPAETSTVCDCDPPPQVQEHILSAFDNATAVFVGEVIRITTLKPKQRRRCLAETSGLEQHVCYGNLVRVRVSRAWKGVETRTITVRGGGTNCAYPFEVGREYIVYSSATDAKTVTDGGWCSLTRPVARATLDLELLGRPVFDWSGDA